MTCGACGNPVQPAWKACPACGERVATADRCPACQAEITPGWKACPGCGQRLGAAAPRPAGLDNTEGVMKAEGDIVGGSKHVGDVKTAGGATVGGGFHVNIGGAAAGASAEFEYERLVETVLGAGGTLDAARAHLDSARARLGLTRKAAREIEQAFGLPPAPPPGRSPEPAPAVVPPRPSLAPSPPPGRGPERAPIVVPPQPSIVQVRPPTDSLGEIKASVARMRAEYQRAVARGAVSDDEPDPMRFQGPRLLPHDEDPGFDHLKYLPKELLVTPDGRFLISSHDLRAWETESWTPRLRLPSGDVDPANLVQHIAASPGGNLLAGVAFGLGAEGHVHLWSWPDAQHLRSLPILKEGEDAHAASFSADGRLLAVGTAVGLVVLDLWAGGPARRLGEAVTMSVAFEGNDRLWTVGEDGPVRWRLDDGVSEDLYPVNIHRASALRKSEAITVAPDGRTIAMVGDGGAFLYDSAQATVRDLGEQAAQCLAFSPDGRYLAVGGRGLWIHDLTGTRPARALESSLSRPTSLTFACGGKILAASHRGEDAAEIGLWGTSGREA